ncbi:HipA family kinase [Novosphingobium resinovorum]|uniref:HipA family kinase n=1 Tax=Novosphingobium resinovorum TaxID=158500 RepID=UPI002ED670F8|nr:HipA family kinase [Novosphingobium resinovorum]
MHFQEIVEIVRPTDSGVTQPYQCRLADDNLYAVKGRGATARGLMAEIACATLGRAIGLPIPDFCIGVMDEKLLEASGDSYVSSSLGAGECFASLWIEPTDVFSLSMKRHVDIKELAKLFVFDHWINNGDRTLTPMGGNVRTGWWLHIAPYQPCYPICLKLGWKTRQLH